MDRLRLDHAGIAALLKSAKVAESVHELAEKTATVVRASDPVTRHDLAATIKVERYETDRAAASVTIAHPAGLGIQAKHGTLTSAAGEVGLEVRSRE